MTEQEINVMTEKEIKMWAALTHIAAFSFFVIPFGNILGPLSIWIIKKNHSDFIDIHGKEAINFQISVTIYTIIASALIILLIGIPMLILVLLIAFIFPVIAAVRAIDGEYYYYPITIEFIK